MNDRAAPVAGHSLEHDAEAFGSPDKERRTEIPSDVLAAIREGLTCLRLATTILTCLSAAANHDVRIDTSSAGVAEVACRLIGMAADQLVAATNTGVPGVAK